MEKFIGANRLPGDVVRVGIRPVIDGRRRGVRESLEEQTMGMAKAAAELISSELRYANGMPVECVIADRCIAGAAEAAACADKFSKNNVGVSLTVTPCWCYGSETMDMDPLTPKAVWGFNGTERPGAVYLAAVLAAHSQKGLPAFGIYGHDVQDADDKTIPADVRTKILRFTKAALAVATMRGRSYLSMGSVSMGIAGSIVDPNVFEDYFGMRCVSVDMSEFIRRVNENIFDPEEYKIAYEWTKKNCCQGEDVYNEKPLSAERQEEVWQYVVKMAMITKDLMSGNPKLTELGFEEEAMGHNALVSGFQGQRQWTDHMPNGDYLEAILNSSFDWTGLRQPYVVATENDAMNGMAMLFSNLLTGQAAAFSDVRTYWSPDAFKRISGKAPEGLAKDGFIHLINSGATCLDAAGCQETDGKPVMKPFWEISDKEAQDCLDATKWVPASLGYFRGGGYSSCFKTRGGMPVTLSRLNNVKGLGLVLQIAEGWTCDIDDDAFELINKRTDPGWPSTFFAPRLTGKGAFKDVYSVMANWGANHGAFTYGHIGADLLSMAAMLRIPVCMHNVPEEDIYRPSTWGAFGMDAEGADFRACAALGPIYR